MCKVAVISTVKAPVEELHLFVNYHTNIGVDQIIFFFDDPIDNEIASFAQYKNVCAIPCSEAYWSVKTGKRPDALEDRQIINVNEGVKFALLQNCNWIIHIDSDELIHPLRNGLKETLSVCVADALRFSMLEAVSTSEKQDHIFQSSMFKKKANIVQRLVAKGLGCSNAILGVEYFRGHSSSKMAIKITSEIKSYRIHGAYKNRGRLVVENTNDIQLLHYDGVGFDNWQEKWEGRLNGSTTLRTMRKNRITQLMLYENAKNQGHEALSQVYRRLQCIPQQERKILRRLGMLTCNELEQSLFNPRI